MTDGPGAAASRRRGIERLRDARVVVWGTGAEGTAAAALARSLGAHVTIVADGATDAAQSASDGATSPAGPVLAPAVLEQRPCDVVVRSPGVSRYRPELAAAARRGAVVTTLTAIWLEDFGDGPVLAVTGSKGKTTTATLAAAALRASGRHVALVGNMGRPVAELYGIGGGTPPARSGVARSSGRGGVSSQERGGARAPDAVVIEVSSYQAAEVTVSPRVGVLTLLAPDHLDWHGSYERYVADKLNLFDHRPDARVAVNATDSEAWSAAERFAGRTPYGRAGDRAAVAGGPGEERAVVVAGRPYLAAGELARSAFALRGEHNLVNLCGALVAVELLTGTVPDPAALLATLDATEPLGSRLRTVATVGGLELVDDALASNPAGVVAALRTFAGRRVCLIAGGADRGVGFGSLVDALAACDPEPSVVVLGPAGRRLALDLSARCPGIAVATARSVGESVGIAAGLLGGDGVVLFSPGAPTPGEVGSYADRSAAFAAAVPDLRRATGGDQNGRAGDPGGGAGPAGDDRC